EDWVKTGCALALYLLVSDVSNRPALTRLDQRATCRAATHSAIDYRGMLPASREVGDADTGDRREEQRSRRLLGACNSASRTGPQRTIATPSATGGVRAGRRLRGGDGAPT